MRHAAQYLRMSTDQQPFSIAGQEAVIAEFASKNEISIVATYSDEARSGLSLSGRDAMQRLLHDVVQEGCPFTAVLVLDVTRWGRFQDLDESAYYEYHCRKWGVEVLYVMESFRTEHPLGVLLKQLKRTMAAEYSRELGGKVRAGQLHAVSSGYAVGSLPCLGYRRQAVAPNGQGRAVLNSGERKPFVTDRTRWVLGPSSEVARVQKIFTDYVDGKSLTGMCRELAAEGVKSHRGMAITCAMVRDLLKNPIVLGSFEWGARSGRPASSTGMAPLAESVCNRTMLAPIVATETWNQVQSRLKGAYSFSAHRIPAEVLIRKLHDVLRDHPNLTGNEFKQWGLASPSAYYRCFGSLELAYSLAGIEDDTEQRLAAARARSTTMTLRNRLVDDLESLLAAWGVHARRMHRASILVINGVQVAIRIAVPLKSVRANRWETSQIQRCKRPGRWLLVMRLNADVATGRDFYLLPPHVLQQFKGVISTKVAARLCEFQLGTGAAVARALSELGGQQQLV